MGKLKTAFLSDVVLASSSFTLDLVIDLMLSSLVSVVDVSAPGVVSHSTKRQDVWGSDVHAVTQLSDKMLS